MNNSSFRKILLNLGLIKTVVILKIIKLIFVLVSCSVFFYCSSNQFIDKPNIILIMSDDMGYSDISSYGGEISTPNIDDLAMKGLRFTQFYNTSRCCPTRASLLTGLYAHQAGMGGMADSGDRGTPAFRGDLSNNAVTIAEVLKESGYSTYLSGKWHITPYDDSPEGIKNPNKSNWPVQRGFDKFFGMISGAGSFFDPRSLAIDNEYIAPTKDFYFTDKVTDYAVKFINQNSNKNPFFMYVAYTAPHWPLHALSEDIEKYKGKYDKGWDQIRKERFSRMKEMGIIKDQWELTSRDINVKDWSEEIEDRDWEIRNMEVYAAMIDRMDNGIGKIINSLKEKGEYENTLIFYLQDNGACSEELDWIKDRQVPDVSQKPMDPLAIQTKMIPTITREGEPVRLMKNALAGGPESYSAYGPSWANASNTPFREYKHYVHEGGIATPLIVHWPNTIKANGDFRRQPSHLIDIMATCVEVSGSKYPRNYKGNTITPMEGKSLVPAFTNSNLNREALYWEHSGNRAVRMGKWKLVSKAGKDLKMTGQWDKIDKLDQELWELFDMEIDRTETNDISNKHPEKVKVMSQMWMEWARKTGAIPRPN